MTQVNFVLTVDVTKRIATVVIFSIFFCFQLSQLVAGYLSIREFNKASNRTLSSQLGGFLKANFNFRCNTPSTPVIISFAFHACLNKVSTRAVSLGILEREMFAYPANPVSGRRCTTWARYDLNRLQLYAGRKNLALAKKRNRI